MCRGSKYHMILHGILANDQTAVEILRQIIFLKDNQVKQQSEPKQPGQGKKFSRNLKFFVAIMSILV